jgi:hypothetical protein
MERVFGPSSRSIDDESANSGHLVLDNMSLLLHAASDDSPSDVLSTLLLLLYEFVRLPLSTALCSTRRVSR